MNKRIDWRKYTAAAFAVVVGLYVTSLMFGYGGKGIAIWMIHFGYADYPVLHRIITLALSVIAGYWVCLRLCPARAMKVAAVAFTAWYVLYESAVGTYNAIQEFGNSPTNLLAHTIITFGYAVLIALVGVMMYKFFVKRRINHENMA